MADIERHQLVSCSELAGIDEALAWVVGVYDQEFTGASMVKIAVEQVMRSTADPDDPWRPDVIRRCDGADEYLVDQAGEPCACGLEFDDVETSVVWPHERIPPVGEKIAALEIAALEQLADAHKDCCEIGGWAGELTARLQRGGCAP
jgi:hypothetical protein